MSTLYSINTLIEFSLVPDSYQTPPLANYAIKIDKRNDSITIFLCLYLITTYLQFQKDLKTILLILFGKSDHIQLPL